MKWMLLACLALVISSCDPTITDGANSEYQVYVPVYAAASTSADIRIMAPQPIVKAGKIYAYGPYIFQNELYKGIHVIDNTDPAQPRKLAFLNVPMSTELAIKGSYLYTNNINDLIVIDLHDILNPVVTERIKDAFPVINQEFPPFTGVYFECPDQKKGVVVDWELKMVTEQPKCRR